MPSPRGSYSDLAHLFRHGVESIQEHWPRDRTSPARQRVSQFRASLSKTVQLLSKELRAHDAKDARFFGDFRTRDIRLDGLPRKGSRPDTSAVMVTFHMPRIDDVVRYPCDRWRDWEDNLRAIALTLENLRACDRYGCITSGEQYRGSGLALQAPRSQRSLTKHDAALILDELTNLTWEEILSDPANAKAAYRMAMAKTHPDKWGDRFRDDYEAANAAWAVLQR